MKGKVILAHNKYLIKYRFLSISSINNVNLKSRYLLSKGTFPKSCSIPRLSIALAFQVVIPLDASEIHRRGINLALPQKVDKG